MEAPYTYYRQENSIKCAVGSNVLCTLIFKLFQFGALGGEGVGVVWQNPIGTDTSHTPGEGLLFTLIVWSVHDPFYEIFTWMLLYYWLV